MSALQQGAGGLGELLPQLPSSLPLLGALKASLTLDLPLCCNDPVCWPTLRTYPLSFSWSSTIEILGVQTHRASYGRYTTPRGVIPGAWLGSCPHQ